MGNWQSPSETTIQSTWLHADDKIRVSVSIPTYNHGNFIEQCLHSVLNQKTSFPFEIIVHDDASTDGTTEILKTYEKQYPNILKIIVQKENIYQKGGNPGRVIAEKCRGNYIAFCEGDDYWSDPLKLQKQFDYMENHPECVMTYHPSDTVDSKGDFIRTFVGKRAKNFLPLEAAGSPMVHNLTRMYRHIDLSDFRSGMEEAKITAGDIVITAALSQFGCVDFIADILPSKYRIHSAGEWSSKSSTEQMERDLLARIFIIKKFNSLGLHNHEFSAKKALIKSLLFSTFRSQKRQLIAFLFDIIKTIYRSATNKIWLRLTS